MAWIQLRSLSNADFVDFDVIDQMINNIYFLRAAIPEIHVRKPDGTTLYADGNTDTRLRIQSGVLNLNGFTGNKVFTVKLIKPHTGTADYPILLTLATNVDIRVSISSQNNKEFNVRVIPTGKSAMRGVKINWMAVTKE